MRGDIKDLIDFNTLISTKAGKNLWSIYDGNNTKIDKFKE